MNTKLTLNLNKHIIEIAKDYAKNHKVSLPQVIENYLYALIKKEESNITISPLVQSLAGVIPNEADNTGFRKDYYDYLNEKYS